MKGYELRIRFCLFHNVEKENINMIIASAINKLMEKSQYLKEVHQKQGFKKYCISGVTPFEKINYKEAELYDFFIRTKDLKLIQNFRIAANDFENNTLMILDTEINIIDNRNKRIDLIETITPTVAVLRDNKTNKTVSWTKERGLPVLENAIINNLIKKSGLEIVDKTNLIKDIKLKSEYPVVINYKKNSKIVGYKLKIKFEDNEMAQELANIALFEGVLTKNASLCCGFAKAFYNYSNDKQVTSNDK
ncbi:MAG: hypothetical protein ACRCWG_06120 [Sarcina sp.]